MDPIADASAHGFDPPRLTRITDWMQRWVDSGRIPAAAVLVARGGEVVFHGRTGFADVETKRPWREDTIARFYSMTKPVASVALMSLYEKGLFHLDDPVDAFIPSFRDRMALIAGATRIDQVEPARTRMTVHHLLTHTSGLTYGFNGGVLGEAYVAKKIDFGPRRGGLRQMIDRVAELPLAFDPGARWNYGVSTDVVGRLIEIISGEPLDRFLAKTVLEPLGMTDTAFGVPDAKLDRFATLYTVAEDGQSKKVMETVAASAWRADGVDTLSAGGGLVSTMGDYFRFCEMLRRGGTAGWDGTAERILGPRTIRFMRANHMPGDLASMGMPVFSEVSFVGVGFGLGFWSTINPARAQVMASPGDYGWGGMASTAFWNDPVEDMTVIFLTQLVPSSRWPLRKELRALVHQALVD